MSHTTYLDELRQLVRAQTTKIGVPVANIHGGVSTLATTLGQSSAGSAQWSIGTSSSLAVSSVEAFHQDRLTSPSPAPNQTATADAGALVVSGQAANTMLLSGSIQLQQPRSFPLAIDTGSDAPYIVSVDGHMWQQGTGAAVVTITLAAGTHSLEVLGSSSTVGVRTPSDLTVTPGFDAVKAPVWLSVETGYQDTGSGAATNVLTWYADIRAAQWRVLRREFTLLSQITAFGPVDSNGEFTVALDGQQDVDTGVNLFAGSEEMGRVVNVQYDATDDVTNARLRLSPNVFGTNSQWAGRVAQQGDLKQVAIVNQTGSSVASWSDPNVQTGVKYAYALQAQGISANATWSPTSELRSVQSGDKDAPSSIVFDVGFPQVVLGLGRVRFTTPGDTDYAGVKIYYRKFYTGSVSSSTGSTLTGGGGAFPVSVIGWTARITSGSQKLQERLITGSTSTQITVSPNWATNPSGGSNYIVFLDTPVKTEYGVPNRIEDGTFEPVSLDTVGPTQLYQFRSFDKAGNEQSDQDCATWTFDPSLDQGAVGTINFLWNTGDKGLNPGLTADFELDFACTVIGVSIYCTDPVGGGTVAFDVQKVAFSGYPGSAVSIVASAPPTLTAATKSNDTTLIGWTTSLAKGDIVRVIVKSSPAPVILTGTLSLRVHRTFF